MTTPGLPTDLPVPPAFVAGADEFNRQLFWECHEILEAIWLPAPEPLKTFLQGLIQVAAGCVHIQRVNAKGAVSKLSAGLEKLHRTRHEPVFHTWMDVDRFIAEAEEALAEVERLGPDRLERFCPGKFPVWQLRADGAPNA